MIFKKETIVFNKTFLFYYVNNIYKIIICDIVHRMLFCHHYRESRVRCNDNANGR